MPSAGARCPVPRCRGAFPYSWVRTIKQFGVTPLGLRCLVKVPARALKKEAISKCAPLTPTTIVQVYPVTLRAAADKKCSMV